MVYRAIRQVSCTVRKQVVLLAVCLLLVACASRAWAVEIHWDADGASPPDGFFDEPANWNPNQMPDYRDTIAFDLPDTYTVTFDYNYRTTGAFEIHNGDVTLAKSGSTQTWQVEDHSTVDDANLTVDGMALKLRRKYCCDWSYKDINIGYYGTGELTIKNGGQVINDDGYIGRESGSSGTVTVTGAGSTWKRSGLFSHVGGHGTGELTIENGGKVTGVAYIGRYSGSSGTVTVTGAGSMFDGSIRVGYDGTGELIIKDGGKVAGSCHIGPGGIVTVTGTGSTLGDSYDDCSLTVGSGGELYITDGGKANCDSVHIGSDSVTGVVTVTGSGSTLVNSEWWLIVGNGGDGELNIENGGKVESRTCHIGFRGDAIGIVTVTGHGSTWVNLYNIYVGHEGTGELTIKDGGKVESSFGNIGLMDGSTGIVTITGAGSTWINSDSLRVGYGYDVTGELTIENGGKAESSSGYIAYSSGATGTVTVTGPESAWINSGDLCIGGGNEEPQNLTLGNGTLTIIDGGKVENYNGYIGYGDRYNGTVIVTGSGSTWDNHNDLYVGGSDTAAGKTGNLTVENGGQVNVIGTLKAWDTGTITLDGGEIVANEIVLEPGSTLEGSGTIHGNVTAEGVVGPGCSPGVMTIGGDYTQTADAELWIELAGLGQGAEYDLLKINGAATLAGTLNVDLLDGFMPTEGDSFEFLTATGGVSGIFDVPDLPALDGGLHWELYYDANSVSLSAVPEPGALALLAVLGLIGLLLYVRKSVHS